MLCDFDYVCKLIRPQEAWKACRYAAQKSIKKMKFRLPESYFEDYFLKKYKENAVRKKSDKETDQILYDKRVYEDIRNFIKKNKKENSFPDYLSVFSLGLSDTTFSRLFSRKDKEGIDSKGHPIEVMDVVTRYLTDNADTFLFIHFSIDSTTKLREFVHPKSLEEFEQIRTHEDILRLYKRWKILPDELEDHIKSMEIDYHVKQKPDPQSVNIPKTKRTGKPILNRWRFWLPNKTTNQYSKKIWDALKTGLNLQSNEVSEYVALIFEKLDDFIGLCQRDDTILNDHDMQTHVEEMGLFPDEESVFQLFDRERIENHDPIKGGGCDLRSLDIFVSFVSHLNGGRAMTFRDYLGLVERRQIAEFLTPWWKKKREKAKKIGNDVFSSEKNWVVLYEEIETGEEATDELGIPENDALSNKNKEPEHGQRNKYKHWRFIFLALILLVGGRTIYHWSTRLEYECYKYQKYPSDLGKKSSSLRIVILPFDKGEYEVEEPFECMLYGKMQNLRNSYVYIDSTIFSSSNIEIILGTDDGYEWHENYDDLEVVREIGNDYQADYVIWGKYSREKEDEPNEATYAIMGHWTGEKNNPFSSENFEYVNSWSEEKIASPMTQMNEIIGRFNKKVITEKKANFYNVQGVDSKHIDEHFQNIIYFQLYHTGQYQKAYEILESQNNSVALGMQLQCVWKDRELNNPFSKKITKILKNHQFSVKDYPLMLVLHTYYLSLFITSYNSGDEGLKNNLSKAFYLADSCTKYARKYYDDIYEVPETMSIIEANLSDSLQLHDLYLFQKTKGHYHFWVSGDVKRALDHYDTCFLYKDLALIECQYSDLNIIHFITEKGYFLDAINYLKWAIKESSPDLKTDSIYLLPDPIIDEARECVVSAFSGGRMDLRCQILYWWGMISRLILTEQMLYLKKTFRDNLEQDELVDLEKRRIVFFGGRRLTATSYLQILQDIRR